MKQNYSELPNGYLESINKGINAVRNFRGGMTEGNLSRDKAIARLKMEIETADAIVIGAGAGLSTAAGLPIVESASKSISEILRQGLGSVICIPEASIPSRMRKSAGRGGQGISTITVMSPHQSRSMTTCKSSYRINGDSGDVIKQLL